MSPWWIVYGVALLAVTWWVGPRQSSRWNTCCVSWQTLVVLFTAGTRQWWFAALNVALVLLWIRALRISRERERLQRDWRSFIDGHDFVDDA